jgi:hypothetical protein
MAALRQWTDPATGAVMVHDPHHATLTGILPLTHAAFVLLDPVDQERRVQGWGKVLATCCRSGIIARVQVLERTLPDAGSGLADWWATHHRQDDTPTARIYKELIDRAGPASERHTTTISLALDMRAAAKAIHSAGRGITGAARVLGQELHTLTGALRAADLHPGPPLAPEDLAVILRAAYDPAATATLDSHPRTGRDLDTAGPLAVAESWTHLRTDSAWHQVAWVCQWPQSQVYPGFLAPLLLTTRIRRTFSLTAIPIRADQAARDLRRKKTEHIADRAQRAKIGQIDDATQTAEYADVVKQETELTSGHGICRYTALIAVTADTPDQLTAAMATINQAAIQAGCETRILAGQQTQAFAAAALPLARPI